MNSNPSEFVDSEEAQGFGEIFRSMRLQSLLTLLLLAVIIPLLLALTYVINLQAGRLLEQQAQDKLQLNTEKLASSLNSWMKVHQGMLNFMASQPQITGMEAEEQKPLLQGLAEAYPYLYLTMTTGLDGINIARNDNAENTDYHDRSWFKDGAAGSSMALQTVIGRTTGQPALVMATAIRDERNRIVGVGAVVSELDELSKEVEASRIGASGYAYVIDDLNNVIAHPELTSSGELQKLSGYPPVQALRGGVVGAYRFTDADGTAWRADIRPLANGWGVITQQKEEELIAPQRTFRITAFLLSLGAIIVLMALASLVIRQALRPVADLTAVAVAVAAGDLNQTAPVRREDEIGLLAVAFNQMTAQLRDMIATLEQRIEERTRALRTSFDVSRRLASIQNLDELLARVVEEVKVAFDYYHVQIYLYDEASEYLIMQGGTGDAGQRMLEQGHKLERGRGLVGRAAETRETIYVPDTRQDPAWLPNALLPETKSEVAVPLMSAEQVLGVLDVQMGQAQELSPEDLELLQTVANQVAIAVQNARRYTMAQAEAEMEAWAGAVSQKIQSAASVESVLEIAVRELSESLGARQGQIQVTLKGTR